MGSGRGDPLSLSSLGSQREGGVRLNWGFATDGDLGQEGKMGMVILLPFEKELSGGMVCVCGVFCVGIGRLTWSCPSLSVCVFVCVCVEVCTIRDDE